MEKITYKELVKICEKEGWEVETNDDTIDLIKNSPAGEDFSFNINKDENYVSQIEEYADSFDVDSHVEMWLEAKAQGVRGIPCVKVLLEDAEDIKQMLYDLVNAINEYLEINKR